MTTNALPKDPRQGWTSASNAGADALCPARHLMQRGQPEDTSPLAESGNRIHAALAATDPGDGHNHGNRPLVSRLTPDELDVYERCQSIRIKLTAGLFTDVGKTGYKEFREQRYWATFKHGGKEYSHSGQADFVGVAGTKALVVDYKTQRGEVTASPTNMQLRDLACLVRGTFNGIDEITVAIIQPLATESPMLTVYGREDLDRATREMFQRVVASNTPGSKPVPGEEQCKYCRARSICVEYQKWAGSVAPPALLTALDVPMKEWTPEQCARAAAAIGPLEKFMDEVKAMLKDRLVRDPESVPGWELRPGNIRQSISDPQGVFERFCALGGTAEQFLRCVNITKGKVREVLSALTGARGQKLDAAMNTLTEDMVTTEQAAPSLKRKEGSK